ncbi:MAG TPA: amino acid adenylation domain-containing protein, partial [Thermoanaerobaculia bacterium]|nr:amino acid adenylation domain-containing protein [Thermoanaerobaculia bacterium]
GLTESERRERQREELRRDRARGFRLDEPPLLRLLLTRTAADRHELSLTLHQMMIDGWSLPLVLGEVLSCYEALRQGLEPSLEPPRPYSDYIAWLQGQDPMDLESYWRATLAGFERPTSPPVSHPAGAGQDGGHRMEVVEVPFSTSEAVRALARAHRLTLNTLLQGVWALLLGRYSGEQDVVFGTVVAGRPPSLPDVESIVGLFINTLPVRAHLSAEKPALEWLRELQTEQNEREPYQYAPLVQIQKWSELPPGTALFDTLFVFENYPLGDLLQCTPGGLAIRSTRILEQTHYLLDVVVVPGRELTLSIDYSDASFEASAILRMLGQLTTVLQGLVENPLCPLGDLPVLSRGEIHQVLCEWNGGRPCPDGGKCLHEMFARHAASSPTAEALSMEHERLTYRQLNVRANQLAHHLRSLGVSPEVPVTVYLERSNDLVITLLAILKAGGAYLPIDLAYPAERIAHILEDSASPLLLTSSALLPSLPDRLPEVVLVDRDAMVIAGGSVEDPISRCTPENTAYVIYTSGTTGKPKGVAVPHRNVVRLLAATEPWFDFGPEDVWTLFHSCAFDFSVWELWGALLYGGRLVVVPYWVSRSPEAFYDLLSRESVTVLNQTPSAFRQLMWVDEQKRRQLTLRWVVFGGEALEVQSLRGWFDRHGDASPTLVNMYGITETTVHVTYRPLRREGLEPGKGVLGGSIPDLTLYLLDRHLRLVPLGIPGEICVGGAGLARGYVKRPDLTATRFIPDPFSSTPGCRLYRSGDLARRNADGDLEYLGRIDQQVKIRGFRIELGEIEAALDSDSRVRESIVVVLDGGPDQRRLIAYVVCRKAGEPSVSELRESLQQKLPEYMVPAAFVFLDGLPLTTNGKVDRRALPAPEDIGSPGRSGSREALTEVEQVLARIWSEVLGIESVSAEDNFFELGGDSILSIQIVTRAQQAGLRLSPKEIFEHPTLAELAGVTEAAVPTVSDQGPVVGPLPLTPIQHWFFAQDLPEPHHWNQAVLLESRAELDPARLSAAVTELVWHHDALRLRFSRENGRWHQRSAAPELTPLFTWLDLSEVTLERLPTTMEAAADQVQASLDLTSGPLLRVALLRLADPAADRLLIAIHHLAVDGVSWRILLEDLESLYAQTRLPAKTTSFKQWAEWLAEYAISEKLLAEAGFWSSMLQKPMSALPVDFPGGSNCESMSATVSVALTSEETLALLQEVPRPYRTQINDVLLAALAESLSEWTGGSEVLIDVEGHGREEIFESSELSRTVGWFTTIYPVLLDLDGCSGPGDRLKHVKEQLRRIPNRGIGYMVLRFLGGLELGPARPQVLFNYLGQLDSVLSDSRFAPAAESSGQVVSLRGTRSHLLEITASVTGGQLQLDWTFSHALHLEGTLRALAESCLVSLRALIRHCLSPEAGGYTPSDFPEMGFDQTELDRLLLELGGSAEDVG